MQFLLDHLSAIVVSGIVLLILLGVSLASQTSAVQAVQADARFAAADAIVDMLEGDLPNVGAGVAAGDDRILALEGTAALTTAFEFSGAVGASATAAVERVRYELEEAGTVVVGQGAAQQTVPAYTLRRLVHDGSAFRLSGASRSTVTAFTVRLLDAAGAPVGSPLDAARVAEVALATASPLGDGASVSRWQRRFQLLNVTGG